MVFEFRSGLHSILSSHRRCRLALILLNGLLDRIGYQCLDRGRRDHVGLIGLSNASLRECWLGCTRLRDGRLAHCRKALLNSLWLHHAWLRNSRLIHKWLEPCLRGRSCLWGGRLANR